MSTRKLTLEEKVKIVQESEQAGFTETALKYEMRKDGFFSLPGLIILDEITHDKIINAISKLSEMRYFELFIGKDKSLLNSRFINLWYENDLSFTTGNLYSYLLS